MYAEYKTARRDNDVLYMFRVLRFVPLTSKSCFSAQSFRPFSISVVASAKVSTVSDSIIHDHEELKDYYNKIKNASDSDTKNRWRNQFVWELARHSIAEELVVYPAMEKYITPDGKQMADKDRQEHQTVHYSISSIFCTRSLIIGERIIVSSPGYGCHKERI